MTTKNNDQGRVLANFDSYAKSFDDIYGTQDKKLFLTHWIDNWLRKSMFLRFRETLANINHTDINSVLDIGCGSGRYCAEFLKMNKTVTGVDLAPKMLRLAEELCEREAPNGNIIFINGNYTEVSLNKKHDAAVLMGLFDYIEQPELILNKLKDDINTFVLASFPKSGNIFNLIRKVRYYFFKNCPLYFYSKKDLENLFISCGLKKFSIYNSDREYFVKIFLR